MPFPKRFTFILSTSVTLRCFHANNKWPKMHLKSEYFLQHMTCFCVFPNSKRFLFIDSPIGVEQEWRRRFRWRKHSEGMQNENSDTSRSIWLVEVCRHLSVNNSSMHTSVLICFAKMQIFSFARKPFLFAHITEALPTEVGGSLQDPCWWLLQEVRETSNRVVFWPKKMPRVFV